MTKQAFENTTVPETAKAAPEQNHNEHYDPYQEAEYWMRFAHGV